MTCVLSRLDFGLIEWHALSLRRAWAVLGDLASDGAIQSIKNASLSLDAEGEEVRWDVTVCIKLDFIVKSIRDSPRPPKTQGVPLVPPKNLIR